jgi:hypothetical protein
MDLSNTTIILHEDKVITGEFLLDGCTLVAQPSKLRWYLVRKLLRIKRIGRKK